MKKFVILTQFYNPELGEYQQPGELIEADGGKEYILRLARVIGEEVTVDVDNSGKSKGSSTDSAGEHKPRPPAAGSDKRGK